MWCVSISMIRNRNILSFLSNFKFPLCLSVASWGVHEEAACINLILLLIFLSVYHIQTEWNPTFKTFPSYLPKPLRDLMYIINQSNMLNLCVSMISVICHSPQLLTPGYVPIIITTLICLSLCYKYLTDFKTYHFLK